MSYRWPGNVRELRNVIERAVALANPDELGKDGLARLVEVRSTLSRTLASRPSLEVAREQFDRDYLRDLLAATNGDLKRAAEVAEVHPKSLARLLRRYGIGR
jgi:DNA-binding NtrC family response regulator